MRIHGTTFNPRRDIAAVEQDGYIDLVKAFQDGVIPGDVNAPVLEESDIKDSASCFPKPSDIFEHQQQAHTVRLYMDESASVSTDQ